MDAPVDVSVILPVFNAARWLHECLASIAAQVDVKGEPFARGTVCEVSIFDDLSTDESPKIVEEWLPKLQAVGYRTVFTRNDGSGKGCGFAKNQAVRVSHGRFLAFADADDVHCPRRLCMQLAAARERPNAIVGCQFTRTPADATPRYTQWANTLTQAQLYAQQYREVTVLQPTWFLSRQVFDRVGGYDPVKGSPEDLIFFLAHLAKGGELYRVDEPLVVYRYHPEATSLGIHRMELIKLRIAAIESRVLSTLTSFMIWGAGRDGRKFFLSLKVETQRKVAAFLDVDVKKIGTHYMHHQTLQRVPILSYTECKPPVIICVGMEGRGTTFEANLRAAGLTMDREGKDFFLFI